MANKIDYEGNLRVIRAFLKSSENGFEEYVTGKYSSPYDNPDFQFACCDFYAARHALDVAIRTHVDDPKLKVSFSQRLSESADVSHAVEQEFFGDPKPKPKL